jgi:hypothetical protein
MWVKVVGSAVFAATLLSAGCSDPTPARKPATFAQYISSPNGFSLNGVSLNGVGSNGVSLNGVSLNGVSLNGVSLNGVSLNGISLNGTVFTTLSTTPPLKGADFVGAVFIGDLSDGSTLRLRIDAMAQSPSDPEIHFYSVSYEAEGGWQPLCGRDFWGAPIQAIPLQGRWSNEQGVPGGGAKIPDPLSITFACRGAALAKCVELKYKPWKTTTQCPGTRRTDCITPLDPYHQACVRMIRADYCGDGRSWTLNGVPVNLYDGVKIELDTEEWQQEAEWNADGAMCIVMPRVIFPDMPACASPRLPPLGRCFDLKRFNWAGTLLMNELQSQLVAP